MNQQQPGKARYLAAEDKFCDSCGEAIKKQAEICPKCGVRQKGQLSKAVLLIVTFFLGGVGGHKFYTKKYGQGVLYLFLFWTGIPGLIALIEFIIYACTSSEDLQDRYPNCSGGAVFAVFAGFFLIIPVIGILAAIAIPQFAQYRNRSYQVSMESELRTLLTAEQEYFAENQTYTENIDDLNYSTGAPFVTIQVIADQDCFEATVTHAKIEKTVTIDCDGNLSP